MELIKAFAAGFISTLLFHQGMQAALYAIGFWPKPPFAMAATAPLQVPAVISLAFWGGLWGILVWMAMRGAADPGYWVLALVLGAIGPTLVALFVVMPLKGMAVAAGWNPQIIVGALVLNGVWGLGVGLIMRLMANV